MFTRVLCAGHPRFNETPPGYRGRLWIEIAPLSFPVRLTRGDRLCQLRLRARAGGATREELITRIPRDALCWRARRRVLSTRRGALRRGRRHRTARGPRGPRSVRLARASAHRTWSSSRAWCARPRGFLGTGPRERRPLILEPGGFYVFASRERVVIPPQLAAEMLPVDLGLGELRNNYAGFFDNGFGWRERAGAADRAARRRCSRCARTTCPSWSRTVRCFAACASSAPAAGPIASTARAGRSPTRTRT